MPPTTLYVQIALATIPLDRQKATQQILSQSQRPTLRVKARLGFHGLERLEGWCLVAWRSTPSNSLASLGLDITLKYTYLIGPNLLGHFLAVEGIGDDGMAPVPNPDIEAGFCCLGVTLCQRMIFEYVPLKSRPINGDATFSCLSFLSRNRSNGLGSDTIGS